jgi:hypothetical protein
MRTKNIKRERFVRVVERRMEKLLDDFDSLGKCANRSNYDFSEDDVKEIFKEISRKLKEIRTLYNVPASEKRRFKLKK